MIRLFKLIFVIVILAGAYFSFKQHSESVALWYSVTSQQNTKIKFPAVPEHTQKIRDFPIMGQTRLHIYQKQIEDQLFVFIESLPRTKNITKIELNKLEGTVFALNGTINLKKTNKHYFNLDTRPALDYVAHDRKGNLIYCRTIKNDNQLLSIIYASPPEQFSQKRHQQFFNSLQL